MFKSESKCIGEIKAKIVKAIAEYNAALKENNNRAMNTAEASLKKYEGEYADQAFLDTIAYCRNNAANPVLEGLKIYRYQVVGHKTLRNEGTITGFEIDEERVKQIDLVKFISMIEKQNFDYRPLWEYDVEKLGCMLCIRAARNFGYTEDEISKLNRMYYLSKLAKDSKLSGATIGSNSQLAKALQSIIDQIVFVDDGKGRNTYKATSHDATWLTENYLRRNNSKKSADNLVTTWDENGIEWTTNRPTVTVAKLSYMITLVTDIMHQIVLHTGYGIQYKIDKDEMSKIEQEEAARKANAQHEPKVDESNVEEPKVEESKAE